MRFDRLRAMASLGAGELRGAYLDYKQQIVRKAELKRQKAKNDITRARIKAEAAKEMADLETAMWGQDVVKIGGAFIRGLTTPDGSTRKRSTRKRR